jgi:hypothetical protein
MNSSTVDINVKIFVKYVEQPSSKKDTLASVGET